MRFLSALIALCLLTSTAFAQREPSTAHLGKKIANLSFKDEGGKSLSLHDLKDKKAIVLVFLSFECPVSTSYMQPLAHLADEYGKHGVAFVGLTVNDDDTPAQVAKLAKQYNINFPVCIDHKLVAAHALKADITPECFVLDGDFVLRYRGRIDNAYSERLKKHAQVTRHDLQQVIGELLSGRPVAEPATVAVGCPIAREARAIAVTGTVTYHRDVAPILQNHCQQCHRPGEVGPFSLLTYKQAVNWADDIKSYTQKGIMPPWKAVEGPGFHGDRRLARKELDTIAAWVDGGMPEGDLKDAPPARKFTDGWQLGTPDLILSADADFILGPTGPDQFRCFVMPTNLPEDKYVVALEVRPTNPRVVHHTLQYIDANHMGRVLEKAAQAKKTPTDPNHPAETSLDSGPGYTNAMGPGFQAQGGLGGWAPGQMPRYLPEKSGFYLPKNADIVMQVHYHRNGRIEKDRTQVGLYFSKDKVANPWRTGILPGYSMDLFTPLKLLIPGKTRDALKFTIPAGKERYQVHGDLYATDSFKLHTIMPHMHMVGKEIKVTMTPPGGQTSTLIAIKEWDYNWQETYLFEKPIDVPQGTRFHVDAYYDNSVNNPNNPFSPPRNIEHGEETFNEMCYVFLGGTGGTPGKRGLALSPVPFKLPASTAPARPDEPKQEVKPESKQEPKREAKADVKADAKTRPVPFMLTDTQHVMVRVKINGKGPFNFIVDTGAPILFVATSVGQKLGLPADSSGLTVLDKLEFEGGLTLEKEKCRVETPFQLEGMNGMGMAGVELHGILGYTVLAHFRMDFDFTKHAMKWTPLDWNPPPPKGIGGKGADFGLEMLGSLMKYLGPLFGLKPAGNPDSRGFVGIELDEKDGAVTIQKVLAKSPAAEGGLKAGDRIREINGKVVNGSADVQRLTARVLAGQALRMAIQRGEEKMDLRITAGEGL